MNLLFCVEFYSPSTGGMQEVVRRLAEGFVKSGHSITVATTRLAERTFTDLNGVKILPFDIQGKLATGISGEVVSYTNFLINSKFDLIVLFAAQQWTVDVALPILDKIKSKKVFVPTGFSALFEPTFKNYYSQMPDWLKSMDGTIFLSTQYRDFEFSHKHVKDFRIIPNGASEEEFDSIVPGSFRKKYGISDSTKILIHVGSHTGGKGHDETVTVFKKLKSENVLLLIIGNYFNHIHEFPSLSFKDKVKRIVRGNPHCPYSCKFEHESLNETWSFKKKNKQIMIRELSRQDTIEALRDSELFVFLSNIECSPIVLYEAMASNCAIVSTDVGNSSEILDKSNSGVITPTRKNHYGFSFSRISETTKIIDWMLNNTSESETMAKQGNAYWRENATWEKIILDYEAYFKEVLDA